MVVILVALTCLVAILAKAIIHHPAHKRGVRWAETEEQWMMISPKAMVPQGLRA